VFPAIAIASAFRSRYPDAEILFVGAQGRMEMARVPEAGFKFIGLWIRGWQRKISFSNFLFPIKLLVSYVKARAIVARFRPHAVIGTGGYASGPIMLAASRFKVPLIVQEQNSYAGLTNKRIARRATKICVAYPYMEKYFPGEKLVVTGNPVRRDILDLGEKRQRALKHFIFPENGKTLLVIGGSLGAKRINESVLIDLDKLIDAGVQVVWQTGKIYYDSIKLKIANKDLRKVRVYDFIKQMDLAYAASDVVISRSGALAISELCIAGKPAILVPSPNVVEDHQAKNAMALVNEGAAIMVRDREAMEKLVDETLKLIYDQHQCDRLSKKIKAMGKPNATEDIVKEIEKLVVCN